MKQLVLPSWAKAITKGRIEINTDEAYPELLSELGLEADKYGVAVARECAKLDVMYSVAGTDYQAEAGGALTILLSDDEKRWTLKNLPDNEGGKTESDATRGLEAREHYSRIRGI